MLVTVILNVICFVLIDLFVMAYGQILNLNQTNKEPGTNKKTVGFLLLLSITCLTYSQT